MMNLFRKTREYNSRTFNMTNERDIEEFGYILRTIRSFNFIGGLEIFTLYSNNGKANIHVRLKSNMTFETWLVLMGFEEA